MHGKFGTTASTSKGKTSDKSSDNKKPSTRKRKASSDKAGEPSSVHCPSSSGNGEATESSPPGKRAKITDFATAQMRAEESDKDKNAAEDDDDTPEGRKMDSQLYRLAEEIWVGRRKRANAGLRATKLAHSKSEGPAKKKRRKSANKASIGGILLNFGKMGFKSL